MHQIKEKLHTLLFFCKYTVDWKFHFFLLFSSFVLPKFFLANDSTDLFLSSYKNIVYSSSFAILEDNLYDPFPANVGLICCMFLTVHLQSLPAFDHLHHEFHYSCCLTTEIQYLLSHFPFHSKHPTLLPEHLLQSLRFLDIFYVKSSCHNKY